MAKHVGYEVTGSRPVCVDYQDGRTVSYRPGQRFEAAASNVSVQRLLRVKEVRVLGANELVPALPVMLGAPRRVQEVVRAREELAAAQQAAVAKMAQSRRAPPVIEAAKPAPSPMKKKLKKSDGLTDVSGPAADL